MNLNLGSLSIPINAATKRPGQKCDRGQISIGVGMKYTSGSLSEYLAQLKRARTILKDGKQFYINPEL